MISGALTGIKSTFALSPLIVEVVTSWVTLGALFGALVGGELADSIGRKRTVLIAGALFTLGAAVQAFASLLRQCVLRQCVLRQCVSRQCVSRRQTEA